MSYSEADHLRAVSLLSLPENFEEATPAILRLINQAGGGWGVQLGGLFRTAVGAASTSELAYHISDFPAESLSEWVALGGLDPRLNPRGRLQYTQPSFEVLSDQDLATPQELEKSPLYREFYPKVDAPHVAASHYLSQHGLRHVLYVARTQKQGPLGDAERNNLGAILPHLAASMSLRHWIERRGVKLRLESLEAAGIAGLLLDEHRRVAAMTTYGEAFLATCKALRVKEGFLHAASPRDDDVLQSAIALAILPFDDRLGRSKLSSFGISMGGRRRLKIRVSPIGGGGFSLRAGAVALVVLEPEAERFATGEAAASFSLTPAERRLTAELVQGTSLQTYAERQALSINTVRNQLSHIFQKTGTTRQAELVALLLRLEG